MIWPIEIDIRYGQMKASNPALCYPTHFYVTEEHVSRLLKV
jgi:hypothetical protein